MGMVNSLGRSRRQIWPKLLAGDLDGLRLREDLVSGRSVLVGDVPGELPAVPEPLKRYACRNNALAMLALQQIEGEVEAAVARFGPARVGVVLGTSTSGVSDAETAIAAHRQTQTLLPSFHYEQLEFGGLAGFVADLTGAAGPAYTLSTACSSGARALASARSLLALGLCDAVVAGACDSLCGLTAGGFSALQALDPERTRPMSAHRRGLNLGEGAAVFLVTREASGVQLLGVGESSEAHHMSAPDPEGAGAAAAMRAALRDAGARADEILYLNLHGTGTPLNDAMEATAVAAVLGGEVPCSSTKSLVGHTLGAAGAMEAGFCWQMLDAADSSLELLPHVFDGCPDPAIPSIHLATKGERVASRGRDLVMTNSFGFGGNNCTLVLGRGA